MGTPQSISAQSISIPRAPVDEKYTYHWSGLFYAGHDKPKMEDCGGYMKELQHRDTWSATYDFHFSPAIYLNNYRSMATFRGTELAAFDCDDGRLTLAEAQILFAPFHGVIYTSKSHQREKVSPNGRKSEPACDRYRVIVALSRKIEKGNEFGRVLEYIGNLISSCPGARHISAKFNASVPDCLVIPLNGGNGIDVDEVLKLAPPVEVKPVAAKPVVRQSTDSQTVAKIKSALASLSPDCDWKEWCTIGMAIHSENSDWLDLWDDWSKAGATYEEDICEYTWNMFQSKKDGGVSLGTLFHLAKEAGWEGLSSAEKAEVKKIVAAEKAKVGAALQAAAQFEFWFDTANGTNWWLEKHGRYVKFPKEVIESKLGLHGYDTGKRADEFISEARHKYIDLCADNAVEYAGPLAGYRKGVRMMGNKRVLITSEATIIQPVAGSCDTIKNILIDMFGEEQYGYFVGWLKIAYSGLLAGNCNSPGQVVAFCGKRDCGKSYFLQEFLVSKVLGDRKADPYEWMTGNCKFSIELSQSEHWLSSDKNSHKDMRSREQFGIKIKDVAANETRRFEAKGFDAINTQVFCRMTISLNDSDNDLQVLPIIDDSVSDKLCLFRVKRSSRLPAETGAHRDRDRAEFHQKVCAELPAFCQHLLDYQIPDQCLHWRFGVKAYHHPEVLAALRQLGPEAAVIETLRLCIVNLHDQEGLKGSYTATEIERMVSAHPSAWKLLEKASVHRNRGLQMTLTRCAQPGSGWEAVVKKEKATHGINKGSMVYTFDFGTVDGGGADAGQAEPLPSPLPEPPQLPPIALVPVAEMGSAPVVDLSDPITDDMLIALP